jgi:hypothetical protein
MSEKTVTINGTEYDAHTGMPLKKTSKQDTPHATVSKLHPSQTMHHVTQKSQTLNRRAVHHATPSSSISRHNPISHQAIHRHADITKFAPHPAGVNPQKTVSDIGPMTHPMVTRTNQKLHSSASHKNTKSTTKLAQTIKKEAVADALAKAPSHSANNKEVKSTKKHPHLLSIVSASFALLLLGGYFTYLNMPSLSVRVAAAQAGVDASYPSYHPDGYSLHGPVAYTQGEVSMKFAANTGSQNFTITQSKSGWDSSALLNNYVQQKSNGNEVTNVIHGVTIYTYNDNAAWVNGGILYTINGNAPLSSDQVLHIATSM